MNFLLFGCIAYIFGSIPTAVWLGKKPGIIVLSIDVIKGFLAVYLPFIFLFSTLDFDLLIQIQIVSAILVVLGHVFPIFANFNGGKGVATSLGVIFGIHPLAASICLGIFLIVFIIGNYVSLGAIIASFSFPLIIKFVFSETSIWLNSFSLILSLAVIVAHRKNMVRLLNGTESKMYLLKR